MLSTNYWECNAPPGGPPALLCPAPVARPALPPEPGTAAARRPGGQPIRLLDSSAPRLLDPSVPGDRGASIAGFPASLEHGPLGPLPPWHLGVITPGLLGPSLARS